MSIVVNRKIKKKFMLMLQTEFFNVWFHVCHSCLSGHLQADTAPGGGGRGYSQIWSI